jgi:hypothetical protein
MRKPDSTDILLFISSFALSELVTLPTLTLFGYTLGSGTIGLIIFGLVYLLRRGYNKLIAKIAKDLKDQMNM